ncbi:MAG TPA: hypothetical protein VMS93_09585 [Candidatus Saccharimonadales bacterium]|nr:hypothetical protein [Candidatus Saccharimonadales bacterium]
MKPRHLGPPVLVLLALSLNSCGSSSSGNNTPPGTDQLASAVLNQGDSYHYTFKFAGTDNYYCSIHTTCLGLRGTVVVVPATVTLQPATHQLAIAQQAGGSCYTLTVPLDSVHVGETVAWTNSSPAQHTVTTVPTGGGGGGGYAPGQLAAPRTSAALSPRRGSQRG